MFAKRLLLFVLLMDLSVVGLAGVSLYRDRVHSAQQARDNARGLARVLEQYIVGVIGKMDVGLLGVVSEAQRQHAQGGIDPRSLDDYVDRLCRSLPEMEGLRLTNARGEFISGAGVAPGKHVSIADRDFFIRLRDNPGTGPIISKPLVGRIVGRWLIVVSRRINKPDGSFAGVANAAIALEQFYRVFGAVELGSKGSIELRDDQLGLVVRYPELKQGNFVGNSQVSPRFRALIEAGATTGAYQDRTVLDRIERTFSYRKIAGLPFYVNVGLATDDYLKDWRRESFQVASFVLFFSAVTLFSAWLICREYKRKNDAIAELVLQEAKYHTVADHTYAWEFWLDNDDNFIYTSPSCQRVSGYDAQAFYRDPGLMLNILLPEDHKVYLSHLHYRPGCETDDFLVFRIRHADGSVRWLEHVCHPVIDAAGAVSGRRGSNRDITERKQMEEALRVSEDLFHQFFMQNWEAVVLLRQEDRRVLDANPAMIELFGYGIEELQRLDLWSIARSDAVDDFRLFFEDTARKGEAFLARVVGVCSDKRQISLSARAKVIRLKEEQVIYCSLRDISERIRLEEERKETQSRLINTNKMAALGMLVSGIAHEINNPNQYLSMNAQVLEGIWQEGSSILSRYREKHGDFLLKGLTFDQVMETVPRLLTGLSDGSRRIGLIVNNLKDYARNDSGTHLSRFNLNKCVLDAVQILEYQIHRHTDRFSCDLAGDLPQVRGKGQQIEQVIVNLISNAIDALSQKDQAVRVKSFHDAAAGCVVLTVSDQGAGMENKLLERITEPFFSTKLDKGGTGLGLSISAAIVKEHGGKLEFASTPGAGTTVCIRLLAASTSCGSRANAIGG